MNQTDDPETKQIQSAPNPIAQPTAALEPAFWQGNRFLVPCDCEGEDGQSCGTWLALTQDGILLLEDKDGLRVSCSLPAWLEDPLRYAMQRHKLKLSATRALAIVFEYGGSDRMSLAYITATLKDVFDTAAWIAHINDTALSNVNIRFTDPTVTHSTTSAMDGYRDRLVSDDVTV